MDYACWRDFFVVYRTNRVSADNWIYYSFMETRGDVDEFGHEKTSGLWRIHEKTGEVERVLSDIWTAADFPYSSFVVEGNDFYTIAEQNGKQGLLCYQLDTEIQQFFQKPEAWPESDTLHLEECGDYLVLLCLNFSAPGHTVGMYAARKDEALWEEASWEEVRFPDMLAGTAAPPHSLPVECWYAIVNCEHYGYLFQDGFVYYLNEDWNLCCRPLFGKAEEVTIYEGTALAVDEKGRFRDMSCSLSFGKSHFYYRYYTAFDVEDARENTWDNYKPIPVEWKGYIGKMPGK